jgi:hypothetical protein
MRPNAGEENHVAFAAAFVWLLRGYHRTSPMRLHRIGLIERLGEVISKPIMSFVVEAFDQHLLSHPVHAFASGYA